MVFDVLLVIFCDQGENRIMKAVLIGSGWRSAFYLRIASALPSLLEIVSVYSSSEERAKEMRKKGLNCHSSLCDALTFTHDAVIVSTGKENFYSIMLDLERRGEFILSETSFLSLGESELKSLENTRGAIMEQYPYDPIFAAVLSAAPRLERIDQLMISGLHNHHSAALARIVFSLKDEKPDEVLSLDFPSSMVKTGDRSGIVKGNGVEDYVRRLRILRFGKRLFIHDFSSNQYHSYLMKKSIEIRGEKGILTLDGLKTTDEDGYPLFFPFFFHRDISTWNGSMTLSHINLSDERVYTNPFYPVNLNDDEIGIATIIQNIDSGLPYRSIREGIEDARLGKLL